LQSRLKKYRAELVSLRKLGASYPELVLWLRHEKHTKVTHTTIMRYLAKLPELTEDIYAKLS
jgi:intein-encoded DNA endonuclease-like protein